MAIRKRGEKKTKGVGGGIKEEEEEQEKAVGAKKTKDEVHGDS